MACSGRHRRAFSPSGGEGRFLQGVQTLLAEQQGRVLVPLESQAETSEPRRYIRRDVQQRLQYACSAARSSARTPVQCVISVARQEFLEAAHILSEADPRGQHHHSERRSDVLPYTTRLRHETYLASASITSITSVAMFYKNMMERGPACLAGLRAEAAVSAAAAR